MVAQLAFREYSKGLQRNGLSEEKERRESIINGADED